MKKIIKVILLIFCFFAFFENLSAEDNYGSEIALNKYLSINLPGEGINTRLANNLFQSKGLNSIIEVGNEFYLITVDSSRKVIIRKINDTILEESYDTEIMTRDYEYSDKQYKGAGSVCSDGDKYLYISYYSKDKSVQTAKFSLETKSIIWDRLYRVNDNSKYLPLESLYYKGKIYLLVYEEAGKNSQLVEIDENSGEHKQIYKFGTNYVNTMSVLRENTLALYGRIVRGVYDIFPNIYLADLNIDGTLNWSKEEKLQGLLTRSSSHNEAKYVLYKQQNKTLENTKIIRADEGWWAKEIPYDVNSIYANNNGEYVGYILKNKIGFQNYSDKGVLTMDRHILLNSDALQSNEIYADNKKVILLTSLANNDAVLSFIPLERKSYVYINDKEENYKNTVVYPRVSLTGSNTFTYKIKYVNYLNEKPSGAPKLHIYNNGAEISASPFSMTEEDVSDINYTDGKIYKYTINLNFANNAKYSYKVTVSASDEVFESKQYYYPVYGERPEILYYEADSHIFPLGNKYDTTKLHAKIRVFEPNGYDIDENYPVISVRSEDGMAKIFRQKMKLIKDDKDNNDMKAFEFELGMFEAGKYNYKVEVKNVMEHEGYPAEGSFEIRNSEKLGIKSDTVFNAPNPFNPNRTSTKIVFNAQKDEIVRIKIYSLYGDLIYEDTYSAREGVNEYEYKGRDAKGRTLYNGVYLCQVEKSGGKRLRCKMMVRK